jgi:hypothetical protein
MTTAKLRYRTWPHMSAELTEHERLTGRPAGSQHLRLQVERPRIGTRR